MSPGSQMPRAERICRPATPGANTLFGRRPLQNPRLPPGEVTDGDSFRSDRVSTCFDRRYAAAAPVLGPRSQQPARAAGLGVSLRTVYTRHIHMTESVLAQVDGFNWDEGNIDQNWEKHRLSAPECEETFFNEPCFVAEDVGHSQAEQRFHLLGVTNDQRRLSVVFAVRGTKIRVISARDMSRRERQAYEKLKEDTEVRH